jgi:hypothetical protein
MNLITAAYFWQIMNNLPRMNDTAAAEHNAVERPTI